MTFDEWFTTVRDYNIENVARMAWEAATKAEREACIKECDAQEEYACDVLMCEAERRSAQACGDAIRARSEAAKLAATDKPP